MEQYILLSTLGLEIPTRLYLTQMNWVMWGRDLHFTGVADENDFMLTFLDCRETRWQLYSHIQHEDQPAFPRTELANLKIGRDQHRSPAHLLTEHFGLSLVYGELKLCHDEKITQLGR